MRRYFLLTLSFGFFYFTAWSQEVTTILSDQGSYQLDFSDLDNIMWQFDRNYEIVVKQETDLDLLSNISLELDKDTEESLTNANIYIKHANGLNDSLPRDSFKLQPFDAIYSEYICRLPALQLFDTIEVSYSTTCQPHTNLIKWNIQQAYPVVQSCFQFMLPEGTVYHDHITDSRFLATEEARDTSLKIGRVTVPLKGLKLTFKAIPAFVDEVFSPQPEQVQPAALLAISDLFIGKIELYMPTWTEQVTDLAVSDYFGKQYRARAYYKWLADKASEIINTKYTRKLHLLKLYEFVHQEFEWDGSYGLIPSHSLSEMQDGDKRVNKAAMNMALLALLQEADLAAYPVLVTTTDQMPAYQEIPNLNQFNHFVIAVEIDREIVFVDAGDPLLPIGLIDNGLNRKKAIIIRNYKGSWVEIPDPESTSMILITFEVHEDLSATGSISANFEGYDAFNERHLLSADPNALYWKDRGLALSPDVRIDSVRFNHVKNLLMPFENKVYFHISPSADQEELAFNPIFYSFFNQLYFKETTRSTPVIFPSKIVEKVVFNATFQALKALRIPETLSIRTEDGVSVMSYKTSQQPNQLQCVFDIEIKDPTITPDNYQSLMIYLEQVYAKLNEPIVIGR
ncbi:MAG: hypothetical protein HKN76_09550 [Saprospiraceae bacterium]|nr:hypothetical protein [Saprospiraceae bacterium]